MAKMIIIGSRVHHAVRIPLTGPDHKKGSEVQTIVLNGTNHSEMRNGMGITRDVDADLFQTWMNDAKVHSPALAAALVILDEDQDERKGDELAAVDDELPAADPVQPLPEPVVEHQEPAAASEGLTTEEPAAD